MKLLPLLNQLTNYKKGRTVYTPKVIAPAVLGITGGLGAAALPQTGMNMLNEIAVITAVTLGAWALVYFKLRKAAN
jgi:LPXTG-motif cell wall-anchored protein